MAGEAQADAFARGPLPFFGDCGEDVRGKIEALEHLRDVRLFDMGIFEQREKSLLVGLVDQRLQGIAGSGPRMFRARGKFVSA